MRSGDYFQANARLSSVRGPSGRRRHDGSGRSEPMAPSCSGRPTFRLSDASGVLRFEEFRITGAAECKAMEVAIREYLLGRPLAEVDVDVLRGIHCPAGAGCLLEVIQEVEKYRRLFARRARQKPPPDEANAVTNGLTT